jgi:hypothetical protein
MKENKLNMAKTSERHFPDTCPAYTICSKTFLQVMFIPSEIYRVYIRNVHDFTLTFLIK